MNLLYSIITDHPPYTYIGATIATMVVVIFLTPIMINVAKMKNLLDEPCGRKKHSCGISNFGGIPIFFSLVFFSSLLNINQYFEHWHYVLAATFLLFMVGLKDDLTNISPRKKMLAQVIAASIIVILADIRIESLHGLLGIEELPYIVSVLFSIVGITFVTNAFNLIDGIDGLAGSLSSLIFIFFGLVFAINDFFGLALACFILLGGILGFLRYNFSPAKIFMGDNGSLVIGFIVSILCIEFTSNFSTLSTTKFVSILHLNGGGITIAFAAILIPVIDTFFVFISRLSRGHSPFHPDRKHIHHVLLDTGLNSKKICAILNFSAVVFIFCAVGLSYFAIPTTSSILLLVCFAGGVFLFVKKILPKWKSTK